MLLIKNYGGENREINLLNESFLLHFFEAGSWKWEEGRGELGEVYEIKKSIKGLVLFWV